MMDDKDVQATLRRHIKTATGGLDSSISEIRGKGQDYYQGKPFGNEVDGESRFISTDVRDTIDTVLPDLVGPFVSSNDAVTYSPVGPEDEEHAKQATAYINYKLRNIWFNVCHDWFKDACIEINGVVKAWWDDIPRKKTETYEGLTDQELAQLVMDDKVEVKEHDSRLDEDMIQAMMAAGVPVMAMTELPMLHDVKIERTSVNGLTVMNIPPEEFFIDKRARSIQEATICGHQSVKTESELIEMGYDKEVIQEIPSYDELSQSEERMARDGADNFASGQIDEGPTRTIAYYESYILLDYDEDGIAELRMICSAGPAHEILYNEPCDRRPLFDLTPNRMPHRWQGMSIAEQLFDIQIIKSELERQSLNNVYQVNNARTAVSNKVDIDALLNKKIGGVVQVSVSNGEPVANHIAEMTTPSILNHTMPMVEHLDRVRETRTGVFQYENAMASNTLHDTKGGLDILVGSMHKRVQLIARVFSEMGVKPLFSYLLELATKHQDKAEMVRLRGKFVPMNPSTWNPSMDVTVNIGLGHGTKDQQIMATQMILTNQEKVMAALGPLNPMVSLREIRNALAKQAEAIGFPMVDQFYKDPSDEEIQAYIEQKQAASQQKGNPLAEAEQVKAQGEMAKKQMELQAQGQQAQAELMAKMQVESAKHEREMTEIILKDQRERLAMGLEWNEGEAERAVKVAIEMAKHTRDTMKTQADARLGAADIVARVQSDRMKVGAQMQGKAMDYNAKQQANNNPPAV